MLFAAKLLQEGYAINYAADAKVIHSHEYTCFQQFQRNFDIGHKYPFDTSHIHQNKNTL